MTLRDSFARKLRDQAGANLIEAAIITPLLLLLTFSIVDFGSLFYAYLALENGVSQATRFAVTGNAMTNPSGGTMSREDSIRAAMRNATPTISIPDSAFSFSHMTVGSSSWVSGTGGPTDIEKVTVDYSWALLTPLLRPFFPGGKVHLQVQSAMKNEGRFE
jgi:Flp pilus assembly protein TadG